jgi:hypothetical protein
MKHLPLLSLLALGSATASAAYVPSSLFSSNLEVGYSQVSTDGVAGHLDSWNISATAYLGQSDFFVNAQTTVGGDFGNGADEVSLGYRLKNVGNLADVALAVGSNETYGVALHRALGAGFGAWAGYQHRADGHDVAVTLSKSLTRNISVDLSYVWRTNDVAADQDLWNLGVRYKF